MTEKMGPRSEGERAPAGERHATVPAPAALDPSADLLRSVLDSTFDGILVVDAEGTIVTYNKRFAEMWQLPDDVLASREEKRAVSHAMRMVDDQDEFVGKVTHLYENLEAESYDVIRLRDGRIFERYSKPYRLGGKIRGRVWSFRDVTQQREAEEQLRVSERYYRLITENARDMVSILGVDGTLRYVSPSHKEVLGYAPEELVGVDMRTLIHPDDVAKAEAALDEIARTSHPVPPIELRLRHANGSWRILESVGSNLLHDPLIAGVVSHSRDVTERRRAEQRAQTLLAVAGDIVGTVDLHQMLSRVEQRTAETVPCDAVAVFYDDPQRDVLRVVSHYGFPEHVAPLIARLEHPKPTLPFAQRSARGETVVLRDFDSRPWLPPEMHDIAIASQIIAPFNVWSRHFGLLVAFNFGRGRPFDEDQAELVTGIASQVALAIEALELFRTQREEAEVARALARVGRDLISNINHPQFLDRLCETCADVLGCDVSATLLKRPEENAYVPIAAYGNTPEEKDIARLLKLPYEAMRWLLSKLEREDVMEVTSIPQALLSSEEQQRYGVTAALCMALRTGSEVTGVQVAYRRGGGVFSPTERRIGRGLAQIASLALSHANLVDELERANRVRSEFVATVSHELRTPLNIILGYGDLLLTGTFGELNEEQRGTLQRMDRRARELLDLVNSTLEASRLERGQVPLDLHETSLRDIVTTIDAETRELQEKSGVPVRIEIERNGIPMRTDPSKLKLILKNLVVNALKFTERGSVTVRAQTAGDRVLIEVIDTGIGIPRDTLPMIFQPFRQGHASTAQAQGGVGLGLFIVARFAELLRGNVSVESEVGRGSTFRVELPTRI
ncbi:MAG TPA: PAS domain S-box protein [Candidatus Binatia bacterium]